MQPATVERESQLSYGAWRRSTRAKSGQPALTEAQRNAHIAWDPGALGLSRGLAQRLDATLIHAPVSRLVRHSLALRSPVCRLRGRRPARSQRR